MLTTVSNPHASNPAKEELGPIHLDQVPGSLTLGDNIGDDISPAQPNPEFVTADITNDFDEEEEDFDDFDEDDFDEDFDDDFEEELEDECEEVEDDFDNDLLPVNDDDEKLVELEDDKDEEGDDEEEKKEEKKKA